MAAKLAARGGEFGIPLDVGEALGDAAEEAFRICARGGDRWAKRWCNVAAGGECEGSDDNQRARQAHSAPVAQRSAPGKMICWDSDWSLGYGIHGTKLYPGAAEWNPAD